MRIRLGLTIALLLLAGCSGNDGEQAAAPADEQVLRWGIVGSPEAGDSWEALSDLPVNVPWNLFDPLVKVDDDLQAVPNVAERWEWSDEGRTITFHLRSDGRWTNGDPLTAHDYVYGWRHTLAELRGEAEDAGIFSIIVGANAYATCDPDERACEALWEGVGARALDDHTLEVRLTQPQPWFPELVGGFSCVCFGALHRPSVERFGADWAEPGNIVTSGPFKLVQWTHDESLVLVKNEQWRKAEDVALERIEIRFFRKDVDAVRALEAGELDVTDAEGGTAELRAIYPFMKTQFVGLRVEDIPDPRQRRALALALDRGTIAGKLPAGEARPATSLTADGVPGFGRIASDFLRAEASLEAARRLLAAVEKPRLTLKLWTFDVPAWRAEAAEVRAAWRRLGIETTVTAVPPNEYVPLVLDRELEDAHLFNWSYDAPDPANLLELWRCGFSWNVQDYCDRAYDRLLDRAAGEPDEDARLDLYAQAEALLTGPEGAMPAIPLWWGSRTRLERPSVRETFELNKAAQVDLTKVRIAAG